MELYLSYVFRWQIKKITRENEARKKNLVCFHAYWHHSQCSLVLVYDSHAWPNSKADLEHFRLTDAYIKQQYKSLLDNNKYSDLAIQTNDGVCYVHKVLLVLFDDALVDGVCYFCCCCYSCWCFIYVLIFLSSLYPNAAQTS